MICHYDLTRRRSVQRSGPNLCQSVSLHTYVSSLTVETQSTATPLSQHHTRPPLCHHLTGTTNTHNSQSERNRIRSRRGPILTENLIHTFTLTWYALC